MGGGSERQRSEMGEVKVNDRVPPSARVGDEIFTRDVPRDHASLKSMLHIYS